MLYITLNGNRRQFRQKPQIVMRTINLRLLDPGRWVEDEWLKLIWNTFGHLCVEVRLRDVYRPTANTFSPSFASKEPPVHNYALFFQIGKNLIEAPEINPLIDALEREAERTLKVEVPGGHRHGPPEIGSKYPGFD